MTAQTQMIMTEKKIPTALRTRESGIETLNMVCAVELIKSSATTEVKMTM